MPEVGENRRISGLLKEYYVPIVASLAVFTAGLAARLDKEDNILPKSTIEQQKSGQDSAEINDMEATLNSGGVVGDVGIGLHNVFTPGEGLQKSTGVLRIGNPVSLEDGSVGYFVTAEQPDGSCGVDFIKVSPIDGEYAIEPSKYSPKADIYVADIMVAYPDGSCAVVIDDDPLQTQVGVPIYPSQE